MLLNKATTPLEACNLKFDNGGEGTFEGYASVWGRVDSYNDTVVKGAFTATLDEHKAKSRMPLMLFGHSPGRVIGRWIEMVEDDYGLRARGELTPNHTDAQNVRASMKHGAISGLSIGFRVPEGGAEEKDGGRILKALDLVEVSVVSMPAEDAARIDQVRSEILTLDTIRDCEVWLREAAGFTRSQAKMLLSQVRQVGQREADEQASQIKALEIEARKAESARALAEMMTKLLEKIK